MADIVCLKLDPTGAYERGDTLVVTGSDPIDFKPIVDVAEDNSQVEAGIVVTASPANRKTVLMRFSGTATAKFTVGFFQPSPSIGESLGTQSGDTTPAVGELGLGVILAVDVPAPIFIGGDGFALIKMVGGSGESLVRWLEFNP